MYYIGSMQCNPNYLEHHGVKGQRKGVRRYQNPDGSLTPEGREHYGVGESDEQRHERYKSQKEENAKKLFEGRDRYMKKYERDIDGDTSVFNDDGIDTFGKDAKRNSIHKHDREALKQIVRKAFDRNNEAYGEYTAANHKYDRLFFPNKKKLEEASQKYRKAVDDYYSDFLGETEDYVNRLPKKKRDTGRAYVYELYGFNW